MDKLFKIEDAYINIDNTILQALEQLDRIGTQILFIVNNRKLTACITDGDIRKAILAGKALETKVSEVCNYHPVFVMEEERINAKKIIEERSIQAIPVLNMNNEVITIIFRSTNCKQEYFQRLQLPVVMMAGGKGTRLFPYTKILPKPLLPIADIPISERIISNFQQYGCDEFYMIVNYKKEMIKAYYNEVIKNYKLIFIDEEKPLGTGGGLKLTENYIDSSFIMTNCDILIKDDISKAFEYHKKQHNIATMICSLKNYKIPYGVVKFGKNGQIIEMQEKPDMSFFTNTGCYILEPDVFNYITDDTEIGMPQILTILQEHKFRVGAYPISENSWMDMGQLDTFEIMTNRLENEI